MRAYRKRFVQFNMLLIGLVLLIMVLAIAVYMGRDYYRSLKTTMEQVVAPLGAFSQAPEGQRFPGSPEKPDRRDPGADKDILTIFYNQEDGTYSVLSPNSSYDEETLGEMLGAVISQEADFGVLRGFHAIYYRTGSGSPYKIALASTGYITHSMLRLGLALLAVWLGAMGLFLLISVHLSKIAVRPMDEAIAREKQFVADASHDLKTPLSVILANNAILMENPEQSVGSLRRWTESTQAAAKRMQGLIGEMLTLADVERPDVQLTMESLDAASLVMKTALELESVAYEKGVELETELPDACSVRTNADYFQRIVGSLTENAIKYEPAGGRVLLRLSQKGRRLTLEVCNRSSRIPAEDLPHVFDRFYRGDKSRQGETGGHGLGLAIVKEMTERLGGSVTADSGEDTGTVFRVQLVTC